MRRLADPTSTFGAPCKVPFSGFGRRDQARPRMGPFYECTYCASDKTQLANSSTNVINKIGFGTSDVPLPTLNNGFRPLLGAVGETYNSVLGSTYEVGLGYCLSIVVSAAVSVSFAIALSGPLKSAISTQGNDNKAGSSAGLSQMRLYQSAV